MHIGSKVNRIFFFVPAFSLIPKTSEFSIYEKCETEQGSKLIEEKFICIV